MHGAAVVAAASRDGGGTAWIGLYRPSAEEFAEVARGFSLHELSVEDAVHAHQRPEIERERGGRGRPAVMMDPA